MGAPQMTLTLRVLARLLTYPDAELPLQMPAMVEALAREGALRARRQAEIEHLIDTLEATPALDAEAAYVDLFDRGRSTSLHLFEHVHGDSRDRGQAMVDLAQTYEKAGLYLAPGELPDYLPAALEFASTQPPREARAFLSEIAHILNALFSTLRERQSPYASVLGALIELAGERASAVKVAADEALDAAWEEPPVFGGCSTRGQARPDAPQPIQFVHRERTAPGSAA